MKRRLFTATIAAGAAALAVTATPAQAAPARANQLVCFDGVSEASGNGVCKLISKGATLKNPASGDYSGVYVNGDNLQGKALGAVNNLSFHYTRDTAGGAPRLSLAIDKDADGAWDFFAFADSNGCSQPAAKSNIVNMITRGTQNPTCNIYGEGGALHVGYDAFVAAYPGAVYATDAVSFVIADQAGSYRVAQVKFNKAAAHGR